MSNSMGLSLEQQFNLRSFQTQVQNMSREQAADFLIKLYEEMLVRENVYKDVLKHQWGL
ncbi:phycobilisome degradation protein NblA [Geminocystis sp. NIES-3708]|uniref:NblA/ycf18 family protein n=1 Tax=Geminocystis sp. NIES-3708 TaxID=1615909 RepID=UPI0005FC5DD2|nr:NblA/ycf18 family protein [Geminocystis sp. NIES-3708]BAQ61502.1 phycobilisome degradation protein NblA [Geminocystis sp. NIES-3708]